MSAGSFFLLNTLLIFLPGITFATLYCDRNTREAFYQLFTEFSDTIQQVTGSKLKFRAFNPEGLLRCVILDAEAAQAQGLGDWLVKHNDPVVSKIVTQDPLVIILHVLKTCVFHFNR